MHSRGWSHIAATYDAVACDYAETFSDELDGKPFDRDLLDGLARDIGNDGLICDLGCGPGQIGAYLAQGGCDVIGVDLSPGMLRTAQERHPDLRFQLGDMRALPLADASCAAVVCFYALIHLRRNEVPVALREMHRVLQPDARLILAVHAGEGEAHVEDWFGHSVTVDATLFDSDELIGLLNDAGFTDCRATQREPYASEHPTPRLYLRGTR